MTLIDNLKSRLKECQKCSSQSSTPPAEIFSRWTPSLEAYKQEAKQFLETLSHNLSREWAHDQSPWKKHSSADDLYESRRGLRSQKNFDATLSIEGTAGLMTRHTYRRIACEALAHGEGSHARSSTCWSIAESLLVSDSANARPLAGIFALRLVP